MSDTPLNRKLDRNRVEASAKITKLEADLAAVTAERDALRRDTEMRLPCSVTLGVGMRIGKGCLVSTLILALKNRARYELGAIDPSARSSTASRKSSTGCCV